MLAKSKRSALLLSAITVLVFGLVSALVNILIPYLLTGDLHAIVARPESLDEPSEFVVLFVFVALLLLILIVIVAFWLYRFFGERYYGPRGALRWALFGAIFAVLLKAPDWFLADNLRPLGDVLRILGLFLAFFLARWIVPFKK
jgi:uncharacterized BrkB/YihY/UPF0761 family membrane protein